jgi:hypothetical protein
MKINHQQFRILLLIMALPTFLACGVANAGTIYNDGGIHDINTIMPAGTVDLYNNTTLNANWGSSITGGSEVIADGMGIYGNSTANIYGGSFTGGNGTSAIGIGVYSGAVNIYGGSIKGGYGTSADGLVIQNHDAAFSSIANIYGGSIKGGHGTVAYGLEISYYGTYNNIVNIYGGSIEGGFGYAASAGLFVNGGTVNIYGGSIEGGEEVHDGKVFMYGMNFNYNLGPINTDSGTITGILADGTPINTTFHQNKVGSIVLVPEPASLLLFGVGSLFACSRRAKKSD